MTPVAVEQPEEVKPKTMGETLREEAEALETPQESVAFLQYMQKHALKVQRLQKRLANFSSSLLTLSVIVAAYAMFCYMSQVKVAGASSKDHKLQATREESSPEGFSSLFNGISVMIWTMIAAKAKTGMNAATNGQAKTVESSLKSAGSLIVMIALAAGFNIYVQMEDFNSQSAVAAPGAAVASQHQLQSGLDMDAIVTKRGRSIKTQKNVPSLPAKKTVTKIEAAKPVSASISLIFDSFDKDLAAPTAAPTKKSSQAPVPASIDLLRASFANALPIVDKKVKEVRSQQKFQQVGAFLLFVLTSGISLSYYVTFKTYSASLAKMESLKKLLTNP